MELSEQRLDVWLDVACLFKTRSEAQRACLGGKVDVNGHVARPNRILKTADRLVITRGSAGRQTVVVRGFSTHHVPKAEARRLYEDVTPPLSPEQLEARRFERLMRSTEARHAPDRRERRARRRLKGRDD
jgi:ribosome-associated heat shock protein Hsp15